MNKNKREIVNEMYSSWGFYEGHVTFNHTEAPPWVMDMIHYVHIEMDEPVNKYVFRVIHSLSLYMVQHIDALDAVEFRAFIKGGIAIAREAPLSIRSLKDWISFPDTQRELFCDQYTNENEWNHFSEVLANGYTLWAERVLQHVSDYLLTMESPR